MHSLHLQGQCQRRKINNITDLIGLALVLSHPLQPAFLLRTAPVSVEVATTLLPGAIRDLSRTIARPTSALADSASLRQLSSSPDEFLQNLNHLRSPSVAASRMFSPTRKLKLMLGDQVQQSLVINPNVLYEPGVAIPAALMPKQPTRRPAAPAVMWGASALHHAHTQPNSSYPQSADIRGTIKAVSKSGPITQLGNINHWQLTSSEGRAQTCTLLTSDSTASSKADASTGIEGGRGGRRVGEPGLPSSTGTHARRGTRSKAPTHLRAQDAGLVSDQHQADLAGPVDTSASAKVHVRSRAVPDFDTRPLRPVTESGRSRTTQPKQQQLQASGASVTQAVRSARPGSLYLVTPATTKVSSKSQDISMLRSLSHAYANAEAVTQSLLKQAHTLLGEVSSTISVASSGTAGTAAGVGHSPSTATATSVPAQLPDVCQAPSTLLPAAGATRTSLRDQATGLTHDEAALLSEALHDP